MEYTVCDLKTTAAHLLEFFLGEPFVFLLESRLRHPVHGRYSFIGFDPFDVCRSGYDDPFVPWEKKFLPFEKIAMSCAATLTPFPAGIMGYASYDAGLKSCGIVVKRKQITVPPAMGCLYDCVLTLDHKEKKLIVTSSGLPEKNPLLRKKRARERLKGIMKKLSGLSCGHPASLGDEPVVSYGKMHSNFTKAKYLKTVQKALDYIREGDIYQVNLSQEFTVSANGSAHLFDPCRLYEHLSQLSPTSFSGYFDTKDFQIISNSPEEFLEARGRRVWTRPMKGTRPRGRTRPQDAKYKRDLWKSVKERAELLMVTDLERNDLGRVCDFGSVDVKAMRTLEAYRTVFQATSTVEGRLRADKNHFDLLRACFPGGSITGCPKIRAMQIINELEPSPRSIYTGIMGYMSFSGSMNFNILIRTLLCRAQEISFHVGGGIVADSRPEDEYQETLVKARALMQSLGVKLNSERL